MGSFVSVQCVVQKWCWFSIFVWNPRWPPNGIMGQNLERGTSKFVNWTSWRFQKCKLEKYVFWVCGDPMFRLDYTSLQGIPILVQVLTEKKPSQVFNSVLYRLHPLRAVAIGFFPHAWAVLKISFPPLYQTVAPLRSAWAVKNTVRTWALFPLFLQCMQKRAEDWEDQEIYHCVLPVAFPSALPARLATSWNLTSMPTVRPVSDRNTLDSPSSPTLLAFYEDRHKPFWQQRWHLSHMLQWCHIWISSIPCLNPLSCGLH